MQNRDRDQNTRGIYKKKYLRHSVGKEYKLRKNKPRKTQTRDRY